MSILLHAAAQAAPEPARHPLDLNTPRPVYTDTVPSELPPLQQFTANERTDNLTAARRAELRYPGPAGKLLAAEIRAFNEWGYRGDNNSTVARLIRELMSQPT